MLNSGARGNKSQIRQLAAMRGLMAKPSGDIIESPITSNFREGLTVLEYFISSHGARKGLADTALKTADAGYLTRRLVDVGQDVVIEEHDCGTLNGIWVEPLVNGTETVSPLDERLVGRHVLDDIYVPGEPEPLVRANEEVNQVIAKRIVERGIPSVKIRSVLTCQSKRGVCQLCYGRNLATGKTVELGEAVGIIAAQSIGEPGTQLTMRTFHIGGAANRQVESNEVRLAEAGQIEYTNVRIAVNRDGNRVAVNRGGEIIVKNPDGKEIQRTQVPSGALLHAEDGQKLRKGGLLYEWDPYNVSIVAEAAGRINLIDMVEGVTMRKDINPDTGLEERVITEHKQDCTRRSPSRVTTTRCWPTPPCRRAPTWSCATRCRCRPATSLPRPRASSARRPTSRAACRAWPSCSRRASPKTRPSSATSTARLSWAARPRACARCA
jgi:DNA-directed RNA polymerase subunit beta'